MKVIAEKLAQLPKQNGARARVVVLTHGSLPTVVYRRNYYFSYSMFKIFLKESDFGKHFLAVMLIISFRRYILNKRIYRE